MHVIQVMNRVADEEKKTRSHGSWGVKPETGTDLEKNLGGAKLKRYIDITLSYSLQI